MFNFDRIPDRSGTNSFKWDWKWRGKSSEILPMWVADMDFEAPPEVIAAIMDRAKHGVYGYTFYPQSYFESIINWFDSMHDYKIKREWILTIPGVVPGISFAIQAFTLPGDGIIVQPPVYSPFYKVISELGRKIILNPLKERNGYYEMDFENLLNIIDDRTKMLILCSPHNPVGRVWRKEELLELGKICLKHNILVVSDEIHCDIVYSPHKHTVFSSLSKEISDISLVLTAPSKTFNIAGLQMGNAIIPNFELRKRYKALLKSHHLVMSNLFGIVATEVAYKYGKQWLEELLVYLKGNVDFVQAFLQKNIPEVRLTIPEGTFLLWLDFRQFREDINKMLLSNNLWLSDGNEFGFGGKGFQRMNIATSRDIIKKAMNIIKSTVESVKKV
ncbi:pyridoxal phosphate-dependent aminotransferase [Thermosipho ferrireducens]|uniref:cysteine-S-conjugate beta-lyase n=1 Tax=Thermosipho ferrireducens TaxID=2571116 RepID=A0ABX7S8U8_9BACT|nr:MalY/PatB family protein [Thermosipho ferrireducens]QTA38255.1 pyridoxal phosphate-dependent aminotransferase [Thermosipho ferrireducens]